MEEGFVTILFILLFMAASVIDAVGRKKKRQRRMEEMEAEDSGEQWSPDATGRDDSPVAVEEDPNRYRRAPGGGQPDEDRYRRASSREREPSPTPSAGAPPRERDEESAESMVPEDLWAILTGRAPERPAPEPDPGPRIPAPTPSDRMSRSTLEESRPVEEAEVETRRSSRWMAGMDERGVSDRWSERVEAVDVGEAEVYRQLEEPWGKLEDISKGDLTEVSSPLDSDDDDGIRPRGRARGGAGTPYTRLLETGSTNDLRKAVVLKEVLDRPMALREEIGPLR